MAREGGLGVLHRNLSIEDQAAQVEIVKRSEAGMVTDPVTCRPDATLREADALCAKFRISGVPVTDADGRLLGIITNRDMRFEVDLEPPGPRGDDADAAGHRAGRGQRRGGARAAAQAQDREAAAGRRRRQAARADHRQGLRQDRAVPAGHQGRGRPAALRRRRRGRRGVLQAGDGAGRRRHRRDHGRHRARALDAGRGDGRPAAARRRRAGRHRRRQRRHQGRRAGAGRRRARTRSRSVSGPGRSAPPGSSPGSGCRR